MSVEDFGNPGNGTIAFRGAAPMFCFHCGKPLLATTVYRHGHGGAGIALHPGCAVGHGVDVIFDGKRGLAIEAGRPLAAGIDKSLLAEGETERGGQSR